ncbi:MAG: hypothetical protein ACI9U2_003905 [Bradymonadia bacterium]|jgi:hypothetical protein
MDPQPEQALPIGTVIADRYRIETPLSQGGTSFVYRATDLTLGRAVGLKVMLQHLIGHAQRFENEAQAMSALMHPAVVRIYGLGVLPDRRPYLAMEFVPGETLGARLDRMGAMAPVEAARLIAPVCGALVEAHEAGIRHRDIKPDNIMIQPMIGGRPTVRVLDFGIAGFANPQGRRITRAGQIMGTPEYMAPEQAIGDEAGPGADIWALGVVLHHMLAGQPPFSGKDTPEVLYRLVHGEPDKLPRHIPDRLVRLVADCLKKDAEQRPTAMDVLGRLESFQLGAEIEADVNSTAVAELPSAQFRVADVFAPVPARRSSAWIIAGIVGLLVGAYATWLIAQPGIDFEKNAVSELKASVARLGDLKIADRLIEADLGKAATMWIEARGPDPTTPGWALAAALARLNAGYLRPSIEALNTLLTENPSLRSDPRLVPALVAVLRFKRGEGAVGLLTGPLWPDSQGALRIQPREGVNPRVRNRALKALASKGVNVTALQIFAWQADLGEAKIGCSARKAAFDGLLAVKDALLPSIVDALGDAAKACLGDNSLDRLKAVAP